MRRFIVGGCLFVFAGCAGLATAGPSRAETPWQAVAFAYTSSNQQVSMWAHAGSAGSNCTISAVAGNKIQGNCVPKGSQEDPANQVTFTFTSSIDVNIMTREAAGCTFLLKAAEDGSFFLAPGGIGDSMLCPKMTVSKDLEDGGSFEVDYQYD